MKLTTKQLKKLIKEEFSIIMEMNMKIRELEEKIEMMRQAADDQAGGDQVMAKKIFKDLGGEDLERDLMSMSPGIGSGSKHEMTPMDQNFGV
mgnify:CR=1 FL=1